MMPKECMADVMAGIIGLDNTYKADRLNGETARDQFMDAVFLRMETSGDERVRNRLNSTDRQRFQEWIDDSRYWKAIDHEIHRQKEVMGGR